MTTSPLAISVQDLHKHYGDKHAVDGLDLAIEHGEIFAVLGPNGAGKSTTIEILEGHRKRTSGDVVVLGEDPGKAGRAWRARIGIVLQSSQDQAEITVAEAIRHFATFYPTPRATEELITAVGLEEKRNTRVRNLSGGQRRRLDVALGIVGNPELLFLDEPTTGFDPQARRDFWALIESLKDAGTTIVLTTHYLDEAEQLADRLAVINDGKVLEVATPLTLGGRGARHAVVRWLEDDVERSAQTDTPTSFVADLATRLAPSGGEVAELQVIRPSLEDVYLSMIGEKSHAATPDLKGASK